MVLYSGRPHSVTLAGDQTFSVLLKIPIKRLKEEESVLKLRTMTVVMLLAMACFMAAARPAKIAIIVDDLGYRHTDRLALNLPGEVTFSILPFAQYTDFFVDQAALQGRDIMLHMPMESLEQHNWGERALLSTMYPEEIVFTLNAALADVPGAVGLNNHMGSRLTQLTLPMSSVMQELSRRGLFFIDSKTTRYSRAHQIALQHGVRSRSRHIFLDHERDQQFYNEQFERMLNIARIYGSVIAIAHPHPQSMEWLLHSLDSLPEGYQLVPITELMHVDKQHNLGQSLDHGQQAPSP